MLVVIVIVTIIVIVVVVVVVVVVVFWLKRSEGRHCCTGQPKAGARGMNAACAIYKRVPSTGTSGHLHVQRLEQLDPHLRCLRATLATTGSGQGRDCG